MWPQELFVAFGDAIELAKANRGKEFESKEKKMKKNKNFTLRDNNGLDMSPSDFLRSHRRLK